MKLKEIEIPVGQDRIRRMPDPQGKGRESVFAFVNIKDLPQDLPLEVNPRAQNTDSRVGKQIAAGLLHETDIFHLLSRGMTIAAKSADFDNKTDKLTLTFGDNAHYGVIDGGHNYAVIKELANQVPSTAFVKLEILTNVRDMIVDLARARNTSAQVKDQSLQNLGGLFDWIKIALQDEPYFDKIAFKENEDSELKPIDIREIIGLLTMFHPQFADPETPPVVSYASKGRCLDLFADPKLSGQYENLYKILPDILKLYDWIHKRFPVIYEELGGFSGVAGKETHQVKLAKVIEIKRYLEGYPLYYLGDTTQYKFPDGWLFPILASMRGLVLYKNVYKWKTDPFAFFEEHGKKLVSATLSASKELGRNPNLVGKSKGHWIQLHQKVINLFATMAGFNAEQEIKAAS